jgi:hypothetical protein
MNGAIDWKTVSFTAPGAVVKISDIIAASALHFGLKEAEIKGSCRRRDIARARQIVGYLARELTAQSYPVIARHLGDKDHTTILWGCRKIAALIAGSHEGMVTHVQAVRELVLSGNPRAALAAKNAEAKRRAEAIQAEQDAEAAIRHATRMLQLSRIRTNASPNIHIARPQDRVMS